VTAEEFMDLIDQMRLAVFEEAMLFELPAGSVDDPGGLNVVHGPWEPGDCSAVLTCWFDLGWVALYRPGASCGVGRPAGRAGVANGPWAAPGAGRARRKGAAF
jgi:hypothetical protein